MSDKKLDTEVRREQIAEAVLSLVAAHGVNRLSMARVARHVGLVPSGIYRHFKNKDEMILAALDRIEARLQANIRAAAEESPDPLEQLRILLMRHVRVIREGRAVPRIVFSDDAHSGHPERLARVQKILGAYLGRLAELVRQGQADGTIRPDVDPSTAALMFMGIVVPAGILWHLTDGGFDVTKHAERAWQIFRRAIVAQGSSGPETM
jgi:AcrR family transcriptional regulator